VFQENEGAPWIVTKAMALREHLETIPLYIRQNDRIAGSITEIPGTMPLMVEIGIGENSIFIGEDPQYRGYLRGQVPSDLMGYWEDRNLWGRHRAYMRTVKGIDQKWTEVAGYKFISYQGHLSPSYRELLEVGLSGILKKIVERREREIDPRKLEFLVAAEHCILGLKTWINRYAELLSQEAARSTDPERRSDLDEMSHIARKVASDPPDTFREAMQLIWFVHQAVHIEGHGYSNTPDRIDQILHPFYLRDKATGSLTDDEALSLCENFILKMRDNTYWSVEHNLTQGICLGGSTPEGEDQTNELSWLFITAADNMSLPEPLVWIRWHPSIDQDFLDYCLEKLAGSTCFPLIMSDTAVPKMMMELGVAKEDAFNYVPAGCNELAIPGQAYFNPCAGVGYLSALEHAITGGRGYDGNRPANLNLPNPESLTEFEDLIEAVGMIMRNQITGSYASGMLTLNSQIRWGQTPLTSCFFDNCIEEAHDMIEGTKYNILSCGGVFFPNMVDSLAAIREVVYEKKEATLGDIAAACAANFEGYESLRAKLVGAPKHGNDDERLIDIIRLVERMRDEPLKEICRDPRDGMSFGNCHVVRSSSVRSGANTSATPDGRLAGKPLASSIAAACGNEKSGPTALLNSILALNPVKSWQCGYNVNMRLQNSMLTGKESRAKVRAMLNSFFSKGGQEMQINSVGTATLRDAQRNPEQYRDLVVRVAGFSEFFTKLLPDIQEDVISREEHS
jgi:formate C-acetyltransferase